MTLYHDGQFQTHSNYPEATSSGAPLSSTLKGPYPTWVSPDRAFRRIDPNPIAGTTAKPIIEMNLRVGDTGGVTDDPRCQAQTNKNLPIGGPKVWSGWTAWVPNTMTTAPLEKFQNMHSVTGSPYRSTPISWRTNSGTTWRFAAGGGNAGYVIDLGRRTGRWVGIVEGRVISDDPSIGSVEAYYIDEAELSLGWRKATVAGGGTIWKGAVNGPIDDPFANARLVIYAGKENTHFPIIVRYGAHRIASSFEEAIAENFYPFTEPVVTGSGTSTLAPTNLRPVTNDPVTMEWDGSSTGYIVESSDPGLNTWTQIGSV